MPSLKTLRKQPSEIEHYDVNFDRYFASVEAGDYIQSATVLIVSGNTLLPTDLVLGPGLRPDFEILAGATDNIPAHRIKVWVGDGTNGVTYKITVLATLFSGARKEADFLIRVQEI